MQAKVEPVPDTKIGALTPLGSTAGIPDALKQLIWDPIAVSEAQPVNATEAALAQVIDDKLRVRSTASIPKFLHILQNAKTEADEALVLVVLRATATGTDAKLSAACTAAFEKCGGLKIAKKWLNEAVDWNYSDLLVLLLDVLKVLPVQLSSITEARINEPIVKLRKAAQEDKVRRAAQDLLKHWRGRFTEKEKEKEKAKLPNPPTMTVNAKTETKEAPSGSAPAVTTPKTAAEAAVGDAKPLKKRSIKRLERMPFGGSGNSPASSSSKSSELIGNLMQRKSVKDAAASKTKKAASDNKDSSSSESSSRQVSPDGSSEKESKEELVMQLPTIQSFKAVTTTTSVSKKIRWADEEGKDLVKIKLIESWRDMIHYQPHDESSFKDAKLREHEAERQMMKSHKEREAFNLVMAHEWTTPALVKLPEALAARRERVKTEEVEAQSARTRREMEFVVLDGEVPPLSPKEWTRTNEPHRGAPKEIPLLDVDSAAAAAAAPPVSSYADPSETEEERALREALGPLQRSTIALLMENEHVLPIVYEEAQRNGNRIPDGRVVEIVEFHRRHPPQGQRFNGPPPGAGVPMYDGGYNQYGAGYDYSRQYAPPPHQQMHPQQQSLKRKAPGGILADAPPPSKRLPKRGPSNAAPCVYFMGPAGCKLGSGCQFSHDVAGGPPPGMGGGPYGPPQGGRFGHQPPMGMRGGGGMRGMRR